MSDDFQFLESKTITRDLADILLGNKIGSGMSREVFECRIDKTLVVKIEQSSGSFQNVKEWEMWQEIQHIKELHRWFAPCVSISACGTVLLQKKAVTPYKKDYPKKVPKCIGDLKYQNFGMYNGKFVAIDYGSLISSNGLRTGMKKADWWE